MVAHKLVHLEHVHLSLLEHSLHLIVTQYLPLVVRVLEVIALDVLPQLLHHLRSRQLVAG